MRSWLILIIGLLPLALNAQYLPNNAQAFQFYSLYNPAFTGIENYNDLKLSYRYQWTGFGEYSPKFFNLSYNVRIKQPVDLSFNALRISDPARLKQEKLPRRKRVIHGFGVNVFQSSVAFLNGIGGSLMYSLNYPLSGKWRLSTGVGVVVENRKLELNEIYLGKDADTDPFYNNLLQGSSSQTDLNLRLGVALYKDNFYIGVSYLPVVNTAFQASDLAFDEAFYRASVQTGISFPINEDLTLKPSIMALLQMNNKVSIDYNVKAYIQDKIWFGVSYRDVKSGAGLLGFNFNEKFTASYAYEISLGGFQKFNDGSHELVLSARLNNVKRQRQYLW